MATKEVELVPVEEVKNFAQHIVEESKKSLLEKGYLARVLWLFSTADKLPDSKWIETHNLPSENNPPPGKPKDETTMILAVDMSPGAEGLLGMLLVLFPKFEDDLAFLRSVAPPHLTEGQKSMAILKGFMQVSGMNDGDILARYMAYMVKKVGAYAYVHQAETWWVEAKSDEERKKLPKSLAEYDGRREAIGILWETYDQGEMISIPFLREGGKVGEGKITEFLEPRISKGNEAQGRLVNLLRKTPRM